MFTLDDLWEIGVELARIYSTNSWRYVKPEKWCRPNLNSSLFPFQDREKSAAHSSLLSKDQSVYEIGNHLLLSRAFLYSFLVRHVDRLNKFYLGGVSVCSRILVPSRDDYAL